MIETLRRSPLLLALALLAVVLAVVLAVELRLAAPATRVDAPKGARPVEARLLPAIPARPPEQAYPEVTNRPLFVSTRRPAPDAAPAAAAPKMQPGQFQLQGVIVHGDQRTAILRERSTSKVIRAETGRDLNGMRVAEIKPDSVTLTLGDERETIPLLVQRGPAVAPGQVAAVMPGQPPGMPNVVAPGGGGPFARPASPGTTPGQPAQPQPPGSAASPVAVQGTPNVPGQPPFGPPPATGNAAVPTAPGATPQPQAGPAFPMSPEELLARRRARRAQQNQ